MQVSKELLGERIEFFNRIERLYSSPFLRMTSLKRDHWIHIWHYQFVCYHLFNSFSCLLRCHLSESYASTRAAIDAALQSYYCIEVPTGSQEYEYFVAGEDEDEDGDADADADMDSSNHIPNTDFRYMKAIISRIRRRDPNRFPLAERLLQLYDHFSAYGPHADPKTIHAFRTSLTGDSAAGVQFKLNYFQLPPNRKEFIIWYGLFLDSYFHILKVFKIFLEQNTPTIGTVWEREYSEYLGSLRSLLFSEGITRELLMKAVETSK